MAIDLKDVKEQWARQAEIKRDLYPQERIEYRTLELSNAWSHLQKWIREQVEASDKRLKDDEWAFKVSGDYSHEKLAQQKAAIDISHAETRILHAVQEKILSYHKEETDG